jgi:predicted O-linked N-acetylglucosamine transferase (SPINDLY family)
MNNIDQILAQGTRLHQAGRLQEAEQIYRQVLAADPKHPHALHQFGLLALQAGQFDAAIELIGQAIRADRAQPAFHANLGEAYRHAKRPEQAAESYRYALKLHPGLAAVHVLLGSLLYDQGKYAAAEVPLREAVRLQPENARPRLLLGLSLEGQNKFKDAEACFRRVVRDEDSAQAYCHLASVLQSQQRDGEAIAAYEAAIAREPRHVEAHNNLGTIFKSQRKFAEAEAYFLAALAVNPDFAAGYINLALLRQTQSRFSEAAEDYRRVLRLAPDSAVAQLGFGQVLQKLGQREEARQRFEEAIRLDPSYADAHLSLAYLCQLSGRNDEAIVHCQNALRFHPDWPEAYSNLCVAWADIGRHDEAIAAGERAIALLPNFAMAHSNVAVSLQNQGLLEAALAAHRRAVACDPDNSGLHSNLLYALNYPAASTADALFAEHLAWGQRHAEPLTQASAPHTNERSPERRLRIGYVSPNFCDHAVNFFTQPILAAHDHERFEIYCYADVDQPGDTTRVLQGYADHWRDVLAKSDAEVAEQIRADGIDILVDLTGHIAGGKRMTLFARKPAPIQITYIGYQNTTGMSAMDYRLTDAYSDPPGATEHLHTERLERLPTTFFCYQPSTYAPPVGALPATSNDYVTFGSINAFTKVTPQVLDAWTEILLQVPQSKLVIRADMTNSLQRRLAETFAGRGIGIERLELINRLPRPRYLELIARLDVALDPFPFNGHTTTCDSLWQGVPVITLSGETYVSRFGGSGLATLGLHELITHSREEYIAAAVALANDRARLENYRATLRERMAASPLLDFTTFTRNLEAAYRRMWREWCESRKT